MFGFSLLKLLPLYNTQLGKNLAAAACLLVSSLALLAAATIDIDVSRPPDGIDPSYWESEELKQDLQSAAGDPLVIVGDDKDHSRDRVLFWEFAKAVLGTHFPGYRQEIGDCVSFSCMYAHQGLQVAQIFAGAFAEYRDVHPSYFHGVSRVDFLNGRLRGRDGSTGSAGAKAMLQGALPMGDPGVPPYSGRLAKEWGDRGVPAELKAIAEQYKVREAHRVTTAAEMRDAICNMYPGTIASMFGTKNFDLRDNRWYAKGDGSWSHQMAVIGFDGTVGRKGAFAIKQSWGDNWGKQPLMGEPPGMFWVTFEQMDQICRGGDCWVYSMFDGFPAQEPDWSIITLANTGTEESILVSEKEIESNWMFWNIRVGTVIFLFWGGVALGVFGLWMFEAHGYYNGKYATPVYVLIVFLIFRPNLAFGQEPNFDIIDSQEPAWDLLDGQEEPDFSLLDDKPEIHIVEKETRVEVPVEKIVEVERLVYPAHVVIAYVSPRQAQADGSYRSNCPPCDAMRLDIGQGSAFVRVIFLDYADAPEFFRPMLSDPQQGVPLIWYPEYDKYHTGKRTLEQIEANIRQWEAERAGKKPVSGLSLRPPSKQLTPSARAAWQSGERGWQLTQSP